MRAGRTRRVGDPAVDVVQTLYAGHHGWLRNWLNKRLGNTSDAADLAQDTFTRILEARRKPGAEALRLQEPRAYLTTVAKHVLCNFHRRQSLERAWLDALAQMPEPTSPSPEQRLLILETLHQIDAMLDGLPAKARTAFLMAQLDGMTYQQIADALSVTDRTVRRYMAQAFEQCLMLAA